MTACSICLNGWKSCQFPGSDWCRSERHLEDMAHRINDQINDFNPRTLQPYPAGSRTDAELAAARDADHARELLEATLMPDDLRGSLLHFAQWLFKDGPYEGQERQLVDSYLGTLHATSYIDPEGEERCETCDKWLERGYYSIEDHRKSKEKP